MDLERCAIQAAHASKDALLKVETIEQCVAKMTVIYYKSVDPSQFV